MAEQLRSIVRVLNTDIDGNRKVFIALRKIYGISFIFSNAACSHLNIDKNRKKYPINEYINSCRSKVCICVMEVKIQKIIITISGL